MTTPHPATSTAYFISSFCRVREQNGSELRDVEFDGLHFVPFNEIFIFGGFENFYHSLLKFVF